MTSGHDKLLSKRMFIASLIVLVLTVVNASIFGYSPYHLIGFSLFVFFAMVSFIFRRQDDDTVKNNFVSYRADRLSSNNSRTNSFMTDKSRTDNSSIKNFQTIEAQTRDFKSKRFSRVSVVLGKALLFAIIILLIFLYVFSKKTEVINFLEGIPILWAVIVHIKTEIASGSLLGFAYLNLVVGLFFVSVPVEIIFLAYLAFGHNPLYLAIISIVTAIIAQTFNYLVGFVLGKRLLAIIFKKKYGNIRRNIDLYGGVLIIVGNAFPLPMELGTVFLGATRYSFKKMIFYTLIGRTAKYFLLILGRDYISENIIPWLSS